MTLQHVALETYRENVDAAVRFFAILGFERIAEPATLDGRAVWLAAGPTQIHLLLSEHPVAPPDGHVAIVAPDFDTAVERFRDAGYEVTNAYPHWGAKRAFVRAPGGHRVELMSAPPSS